MLLDEAVAKGFGFVEWMYFDSGPSAYLGVLDDGRYWDVITSYSIHYTKLYEIEQGLAVEAGGDIPPPSGDVQSDLPTVVARIRGIAADITS